MVLDAVGHNAANITSPLTSLGLMYNDYAVHDPNQEVLKAFNKCYEDICDGKINETSITDTINQIVDLVDVTPSIAIGGAINEAVERLISLASRMIKGEGCGQCWTGCKCPKPGSPELHNTFVDAIELLEHTGKTLGLELSLSVKARFSLNMLCEILGPQYSSLRKLSQMSDGGGWEFWVEQLEEMWCQRAPGCQCWDEDHGWANVHHKHCELTQF